MKRIKLEELLSARKNISYPEQYQYIRSLIEKGQIKPVQASALNGKKPALHQAYWILEEQEDDTPYLEEIRFALVPSIAADYYLSHLKVYKEEREWVLKLNDFLKKNLRGGITEDISLNERSFEIWGREKFLQKEQGKKILKHCGLSVGDLGIYRTTEPLVYYTYSRQIPQNILILENKDTFYSMRKQLLNGDNRIFDREIGTLIYGAGKGILRSFEDFHFCVEPYVNAKENTLLYFGDLDYEGIGIYERLAQLFENEAAIIPFVEAYQYMLIKYGTRMDFLPNTSENQNRKLSGMFYSYFDSETGNQMQKILESGKYIPQESLNICDFTRGNHHVV